MNRLILLVLLAAASGVWAQEPESAEEAAPEAASETESESFEGLTDEELADLDLDSQSDHTEADEDVFTPTDVVSFQQSVNFPVDI